MNHNNLSCKGYLTPFAPTASNAAAQPAVIETDAPPDDATLDELRAAAQIISARRSALEA